MRELFCLQDKRGQSYGRCTVQDDLTQILEQTRKADAFILDSPIYFGCVTGEMRSFMERLLFPFMTYTDPLGSLFPRRIDAGFIATMGATEELAKERGFNQHVSFNEMLLKMIFGASESLCSFDTYQFEDYSKVVAVRFDPEKKAKRREEVFPYDCEKAFAMGARFAAKRL